MSGVSDGEDPNVMCATTPAVLRRVQYQGAGSCEQRVCTFVCSCCPGSNVNIPVAIMVLGHVHGRHLGRS